MTTNETAGGVTEIPRLGAASWKLLVEGAALLGAFVYAIGWLFFALFYAEFDVSPESVGIGFPFIVVRVGLLMAAIVCAIGIFALLLPDGFARIVEEGWRLRNRAFVAAFFVIQSLLIIAFVLIGNAWRPWRYAPAGWSIPIAILFIAVAIAIVVAEASLLLVATGYKATEEEVVVGRPVVAVILAVLIGAIFGGSFLGGAPFLAEQVRSGDEFSLFGFRVDAVAPVWSDDAMAEGLDAGEECATLLGEHDGTYVLYFPGAERTVIVSAELVALSRSLEHPCNGKNEGTQ